MEVGDDMKISIDYKEIKVSAEKIKSKVETEIAIKSTMRLSEDMERIAEAWNDEIYKEHEKIIIKRKEEMVVVIKEINQFADLLIAANTIYKSTIDKNLLLVKKLI